MGLTYVVSQPHQQTRHAQQPEQHTQRRSHGQLRSAGLVLNMEAQHDRHRHDGHVDAEAQIRQERPLVRTVVSGIGGLVFEEQGAEERPDEEGRGAGEEAGVVVAEVMC